MKTSLIAVFILSLLISFAPAKKIGVFRRSADIGNPKMAGSARFDKRAVSHGDGLTVMQWRVAKGAAMRDPQDEIFSPEKNVQTVQLERKGTTYTMRVAKKGADLQAVGSHEMTNLSGEVLVGPFICSHNADKVEEAVVRNVQIIRAK